MSLLHKLCRVTVQANAYTLSRNFSVAQRTLSANSNETTTTNKSSDEEQVENINRGGFARAFEKYTAPAKPEEVPVDSQSFAAMLRQSKFIDVSGNIRIHVQSSVYVIYKHCSWEMPRGRW